MIEHQDRQQRSGTENGHLSGGNAARDAASLERPERIRQPIAHHRSSPNGSNSRRDGGGRRGAPTNPPAARSSQVLAERIESELGWRRDPGRQGLPALRLRFGMAAVSR